MGSCIQLYAQPAQVYKTTHINVRQSRDAAQYHKKSKNKENLVFINVFVNISNSSCGHP